MADQDGNHVIRKDHHDPTNNQSCFMISSWPTLATRLLQQGGSSAWYVLDSVMETSTGNANFCHQLNDELDRADLWSKLLPARTKGDVRAETLLTVLQGRMIPIVPDVPVRGDKSLFLTREYRRRPEFAQQHGMLQQLIATVSHTLRVQLSQYIHFDWDLTSVQLAVYPGDGTSGYVRHCDRGQESCRKEPNEEQEITNDMVGASSSNAPPSLLPPPPPPPPHHHPTKGVSQSAPKRIVTCVYYLTDDDWDATLDGGCLRLFRDDKTSDQQHHMVDVTPYRDRLIVFRSDGVEHQVLPSLRRPRTAITLWFYGTPVEVVHVKQATVPSNADLPVMMTAELTIGDASRTNTLHAHKTKVYSGQATARTEIEMGPPPLSIARPLIPVKVQSHSLPSIFVSIASYRDSETAPTLQSLFATALYPARVVVGLVLQLDEQEDAGIWESIKALDCYKTCNIRCIRMAACHALGPCYARALCQSLHRTTEEYVLQIDSHMRFRQNWDDYLIHQLLDTQTRIGHDKVVLTAYPVGYHLPNRIPNEIRGTLLVPWKFDAENGLLRQRGRLLKSIKDEEEEKNAPTPSASAIPCLLYAGGFNFAPARVIHDVPYDQSLHHLFFGEELNMAVRLFTHGYDLFAPPETVCYHLWSRAHRPVQHQHEDPTSRQPIEIEARKQQSLTVVRQLLAGHADLLGSHCGLGTVRTAAKFAEALQVNFQTQDLADGCKNGGLAPEHFVTNSTAFSPDSLETKVSLLDAKVQSMIGGFLGLC
jgi:[Skp1-protein]-hydroxyproline N-acetylglucosaminyltransferase